MDKNNKQKKSIIYCGCILFVQQCTNTTLKQLEHILQAVWFSKLKIEYFVCEKILYWQFPDNKINKIRKSPMKVQVMVNQILSRHEMYSQLLKMQASKQPSHSCNNLQNGHCRTLAKMTDTQCLEEQMQLKIDVYNLTKRQYVVVVHYISTVCSLRIITSKLTIFPNTYHHK